MRLTLQLILRAFTVSWNFLSLRTKHLIRSVGEGLAHAVECKECKVRREWNKELIDENRYLKSLLLESRTEVRAETNPVDYTPIGGVNTWKGLRSRLEKQSVIQKRKNENPELEVKEV